jgi:hypothetical protein
MMITRRERPLRTARLATKDPEEEEDRSHHNLKNEPEALYPTGQTHFLKAQGKK